MNFKHEWIRIMEMMTEQERKRVTQLTAGPVLRTWHGCIERVKALSLGDRWLLCSWFGCDPERLHDALWRCRRWKGEDDGQDKTT